MGYFGKGILERQKAIRQLQKYPSYKSINIMAKQKEKLPIGQILKTLTEQYDFDEREWLREGLTENIKAEALLMKENGNKADKVLSKIEANGK